MSQENFKWVLGRFVRSRHFKSTADSVGAIDGENARSERWVAGRVLTAGS